MKPIGIFGSYLSKCQDIKIKRTPISLHRVRVPPGRSKKVKTYFSSVGSPCTYNQIHTLSDIHSISYILNQIYTQSEMHTIRYTHNQINTQSDFNTLKYAFNQIYMTSDFHKIRHTQNQIYTLLDIAQSDIHKIRYTYNQIHTPYQIYTHQMYTQSDI